MPSFDERVERVESIVGASLPPEYVAFLKSGPPVYDDAFGVPFREDIWNVTDYLELSAGRDYLQLDSMCESVASFFPPYAVPIASDHAGNFFCLYVAGEFSGQVHWWDHERDPDETATEFVATSLSAFLSGIRPIPDDV